MVIKGKANQALFVSRLYSPHTTTIAYATPMCGRFYLEANRQDFIDAFGVECQLAPEPRYNISPGTAIPILYATRDHPVQHTWGEANWGLIPAWADDRSIAHKTINARAETVADKPSFRSAFKKHRGIIPASGFYEWKKVADEKQPYCIKSQHGGLLAFAGLWDVWQDPESNEVVPSCTIITTTANDTIASIHTRMPVILSPDQYDVWLDPKNNNTEQLQSLLQPYAGGLEAYPVSKQVNNPKNDSSECIVRIG
jgi:putative SOS response-associated peptidase YedK